MSVAYDVVIIGAGPGGLMAAKTARQEGLKILLVEQKKDIARVHRTCAEALVTRPHCDGETVTIEGEKIVFHSNDFSIPYRGPWIEMKRYLRISPSGYKITIEREETPVGMIFNKEVLLENLLAEVEKSGCEIQNETIGVRAVNTEEGVTTTLQKNGVQSEVTSKIAIAADGVNSRITQSLGLNKERMFFGTPKVISYILEGVKPAIPNAFIMFQGKTYRGFFMPKAPRKKGDPALHEISGFSEEKINTFMTEGKVSSWFKDARVVKKTSAVMNFYAPIREPLAGKIMIVGDAASFIEVYVQGAIMYGFRAAKAAAKELREGNGLGDYVKYWQDSYEYHIPEKREEAFRTALGITNLMDEEIDYLFALMEPHKIKSYYDEFDAPRNLIAAIKKQIPRMKKERPELAAKIESVFQSTIEEIFEKMGMKKT
jgi:digeranylgeranylglycerophospholipid reductase